MRELWLQVAVVPSWNLLLLMWHQWAAVAVAIAPHDGHVHAEHGGTAKKLQLHKKHRCTARRKTYIVIRHNVSYDTFACSHAITSGEALRLMHAQTQGASNTTARPHQV